MLIPSLFILPVYEIPVSGEVIEVVQLVRVIIKASIKGFISWSHILNRIFPLFLSVLPVSFPAISLALL